MSIPITRDEAKVFFDETGAPKQMTACPVCKRTTHFKSTSDGRLVTFTATDCDHVFEARVASK